jgi:putative molybdopterin biosynthesis protein
MGKSNAEGPLARHVACLELCRDDFMSLSHYTPSMTDRPLRSRLREHRERHELSQQALGELVGVTRQAILAIEAGRQVPATSLALRLARTLRCDVEDLFSLADREQLDVRLAPGTGGPAMGARVALAEIDDEWVAHVLPGDASIAADGILSGVGGGRATVDPLVDPSRLRLGAVVTGCAPLLGLLAKRVGDRYADARATWLPAGSGRSLDLLGDGLAHVAGLHATSPEPGEDNLAVVRRRFPGRGMLVVNLTRWRQGFVLPPGNPRAIRAAADLLRPGLRLARREVDAGAHELVRRLLEVEGAAEATMEGPLAYGHAEVAQLVRCGAADVGVAIESVALAAGLSFVPLSEERFDLVVPAELADHPPVTRLIEAIGERTFRAEVDHLPGYDAELSGHVTTLDAA